MPPTTFGIVEVEKETIAGVFALGRKGQKEVAAALQARGLEEFAHELVRRPGVRARLEDHELPSAKVGGNLRRRARHEAHVRLTLRSERCGDADEDGVRLRETGKLGRRLQPSRRPGHLQPLPVEVLDVAYAEPKGVDLRRIDVEAENPEALLGEGEGQRQPNIAHADDPDDCGAIGDLRPQFV